MSAPAGTVAVPASATWSATWTIRAPQTAQIALLSEVRERLDRRRDAVFEMDEPLRDLEEDLRANLSDRPVPRPDPDVVWHVLCIAVMSRAWEDELIGRFGSERGLTVM